MRYRPSVVVAVPAHDEESTIGRTLEHVLEAAADALRRRVVTRVGVVVTAHRCSDATAAVARSVLGLAGGTVLGVVVEEPALDTIGGVRDRAARHGLALLDQDPRHTWVLSTDADTLVPRSWFVDVVRAADRHDAEAVVGLAALDHFRGSEMAAAAYDAILAAKVRPAADELRQHDHAYGANLAIRGDTYAAVGGFPHVAHGEDQGLVDLLVATGRRVIRTCDVVVTTSGRLDGRAPAGLAALLRRLDEPSTDRGDSSVGSTGTSALEIATTRLAAPESQVLRPSADQCVARSLSWRR
jgi:hypothetical protein